MKRPGLIVVACLGATGAVSLASAQPALERVEAQLRREGLPGGPTAQAAQPGYLGIVGDDRQENNRGVRVLEVMTGSPAAQGGLQADDLITAVDKQPVRSNDDMGKLLQSVAAGNTVTFRVTRSGVEQDVPVILGVRPAPRDRRFAEFGRQPETLPPPDAGGAASPDSPLLPPQGPKLGVRTLPVTAETQRQFQIATPAGAVVTAVTVGSPADRAGIAIGSAITAVDAQPVDSPAALVAIIRQAAGGQTLDVTLNFRGQETHKRVVLDDPAAAGNAPELRAKPVPMPDSGSPLQPNLVAPAPADDRIEQLEQRIVDLENRIKKLEAAQAKPRAK